ncbi:Clr5 domain-containing protein [Colletotrichum phormii]|uniref:Clr5 domain-containing protein n=1 Tax=Colletotrichum phormii TaxID=359342 RepID=A0AAJ0EKB0_9PEZI|nr:Clr5 domain-containing protein [Colletotrichum phormii]KAK1654991.1 Clr5 domain-containing protein [Colletotrichum phormii]
MLQGHARAPSIAPTPKPATGSRPSREQVPAEAWESFKGTIKHLYLEERRPLKEVMQIMADQYGFQATPKMYKTRFSQWGFVKNNTEDEVKRLLSMKFQRDAEGKVSEFVRNGRVVNLGTYLKRKGVTEYDLVDFETPAQLPSYVRCRTPTPPPAPGYLRSPDLLRAQETIVGNMRKAFLHCRQFEVEIDKQVGWTSIMLWGAGSSDMFADANKKFEMGEHDAGGHQLMKAFKRLEMDLKQLSPQGIKELLLGMVHRDAGMMTALCKYLAAYSSTNFERSHPLRQTFSTLYEVQQKHGPITLSELVWGCIPTIAEELEAIYGRRHPYVARTWIDLAIFYNHANPERLEKLLSELQPLRRQIAGRHGQGSAEDLALRYAVVQLMQAAWPNADNTRMEALELWTAMKEAGLVFPVRGAEHNTFCFHSPLKIDPWERRCRERYDIGTQFFQQHCGIKVLPYFEEDMHYTEHAPDSHSALAAALGHMPQSKFSLI